MGYVPKSQRGLRGQRTSSFQENVDELVMEAEARYGERITTEAYGLITNLARVMAERQFPDNTTSQEKYFKRLKEAALKQYGLRGQEVPLCACRQVVEKVAEGDVLASPIFICRECHKIFADGWKWG